MNASDRGAVVRTARLRTAATLLHLLAVQLLIARVASAQRAPARTAGWAFEYASTTSSQGQMVPALDLALDVVVWRGVARVTVRRGGLRTMTGTDGVILIRANDSVLTVVNPQRREALRVAPGDLGGTMGGGASGMQVQVSVIANTTRDIGAGTVSNGYPTKRIEQERTYTVEIGTPTLRRKVWTRQRIVTLLSNSVLKLDAGFVAFATQFLRPLGQPAAVYRALNPNARTAPQGFPLFVGTTMAVVTGGDSIETQTAAIVTRLRAQQVDTTSFLIPTGYRVTEMSRLLQQRAQPRSDSVIRRP